ncbi:MAG TPA: hypothetical protein VGO64_00610 [Candidatus Limnocylindrales bacterium]|nr:hypothetical protein [Candidatus Limnocylindrales bacterium]
MDSRTITVDPVTTKLRRVGRVARRRMRIDAERLRNGTHTDGTLTIEISGLRSPVAGVPETFEWASDRPVALVIVRSGVDGEEVAFEVGPARRGVAQAATARDGAGIRSIAFCYDAAAYVPSQVGAAPVLVRAAPITTAPAASGPIGDPAMSVVSRPSVARALAATLRERSLILARLLAAPRLPLDRRVRLLAGGSAR